jgi:hypothetical protein
MLSCARVYFLKRKNSVSWFSILILYTYVFYFQPLRF